MLVLPSVKPVPGSSRPSAPAWTFLSNHAHVLVAIADDAHARVRDLAARVGITERAVLLILSDLEHAGVIRRFRDGRQNRYEVDANVALRHPLEAHRTVGDIIRLAGEFHE